MHICVLEVYRGGGGTPEKLGGGVRPTSQNPIYDQNLRYSLHYL